MLVQVFAVEGRSLGNDDTDDVAPLAVGDLSTLTKPRQLLQQDIFRCVEVKKLGGVGAHFEAAAAIHLGAGQRGSGRKYIHFKASGLVNEVKAQSPSQIRPCLFEIKVEPRTQPVRKPRRSCFGKFSD